MLIAQLSDTHIVAEGRKTLGVAPMDVNLSRCVAHINHLDPKPDVVLITGDLTNSGRLEEVEHAAKLLSRLDCPYYIIPGNHDDRDTLWQVFGEQACPARADGFLNYVVEGFGVRLIAVDSTLHGAPGGEQCATRLAWLEARLEEEPEKPTLIFMHHPPVKCSVLETDEDGFIGAGLLGDIVGKFSNIERIICGHIHLLVHAGWHGTVISTAPSTGMLLGLDLTMTKANQFYLDAPGYQLHHWTPQKNLITHTVYVRDLDGPYLFEEHPGTGKAEVIG